MDNKFLFCIPGKNLEKWIETNLNSVLCQTYPHWEAVFINDGSTDKTEELYHQIVKDDPRFTYIKHNKSMLAQGIGTKIPFWETVKDPDLILVNLDGDDWLATENTLEQYNDFYNKYDPWVTWGRMLVYTGDDNPGEANPQNSPYPPFVDKYALYRRDVWRASHLRTCRNFLYQKIKIKTSSFSKLNNMEFLHGGDLCEMYPLLEMAPLGKALPVPFFSVVWNADPSKMAGTKERESPNNMIFELEIRNQPRYFRSTSREDLTGDRQKSINVFGDYRERNSILTEATYVYNSDPRFQHDLTVFQDDAVKKYLNGEVILPPKSKVVADLHEPPHLFDQSTVYRIVMENYEKFTRILTFNKNLLHLPNVMYRNGGGEVVLNKSVHTQEYPNLADMSLLQIYPKSKLVSFITSNKQFTSGHIFRCQCAASVSKQIPSVDLFGMGIRPIHGKIEGLKDYRFSVAMENGKVDHYFTEKILDCFLTGTIPIYHGCPNIGNYFNTDGFFIFDTEEDLLNILKSLTSEAYEKRLDIIKENFDRANEWWYDNNRYYNKYLKDLIYAEDSGLS